MTMNRVKAKSLSLKSESEVEEANEELIPSLPNDIALEVLARVPPFQHLNLSRVSKPFKSLLSSPFFSNLGSTLRTTQPVFYTIFHDRFSDIYRWYALYRNHNHPPSFSNSDSLFSIRIPSIPGCYSALKDSAFAVLGTKIYVIGGALYRSRYPDDETPPIANVWVLDCRFNRWERGPTMLVPRRNPVANVVDGKIYVVGGSKSMPKSKLFSKSTRNMNIIIPGEVLNPAVSKSTRNMNIIPVIPGEVHNPAVGKWVELACPPPFVITPTRSRLVNEELEELVGELGAGIAYQKAGDVMDNKMYINTKQGYQAVFDPRNATWEKVVEDERKLCLGTVRINGIMYACFNSRGIYGFDLRAKVWKPLRFLDEKERVPTMSVIGSYTLACAGDGDGGNLLVFWTYNPGMILKHSVTNLWCAEIEVNQDECGELWATKVFYSKKLSAIPTYASILEQLKVVL